MNDMNIVEMDFVSNFQIQLADQEIGMRPKRKHIVLPLRTKIEILTRIDKGEVSARLAKEYNVGKSTVSDIVRNRNRLLEHANLMSDYKLSAKKFIKPHEPDVERTVNAWVLHQQSRGTVVTEDSFKTAVTKIYRSLGGSDKFRPSRVWLQKLRRKCGFLDFISADSPQLIQPAITIKTEPLDEQQEETQLLITNVSCSLGSTSPGDEIPGLPTYAADDVAAHDTIDTRIWVCYKSGVYDITDFVPQHPGGDKIMMAAGGALEPFWELFAIHKNAKVLEMLEDYRIGNLREEDRGLDIDNMGDPFSTDPRRHPALKSRSVKPFNAEPPLELLVENFITPNELFFVRNHLPVPEVDSKLYELEICGIGIKPVFLKLEDLKTKFKKHTVTTTIQCAGNRRSELNEIKEVKGLNWGSAAISTAQWGGARLVDVLKFAGVDFDDSTIQHIQFEGLDTDPANLPYGASVPSDKALDPKNEVIVAYEMNELELPKDHGYPVRIIIPGVVGARNVKWLGKIIVSEEESNSHWQKKDYKGFSPSVNWDNVDFDSAPAIQELPVNSAVCKPSNGSSVSVVDGYVKAAGYAWSGGGRKIIRVDVSSDGGNTWHIATLCQDTGPLYRSWAWTLWVANIPVPEHTSNGAELQIVCKAVDSSYNVQPDTFAPIWNLRGVLGNAWNRISVIVK